MLWALFMYAVWSSLFSIGKSAALCSTPLFLTGSRMAIAGVLLTLFTFVFKKERFRFSGRQWFSLLMLSFFSVYLTNVLEFWALTKLPSAQVCFLYSLSPFFAALFSYLHFGEKVSGKKLIGLLIGIVGFLPGALISLLQEESQLLPTLAMMLAAAATVYGWVLLRLIVKDQGLSSPTANGVSMLIGGTLALSHSYLIEPWLPVTPGLEITFLQLLSLMIIISNLLCYNLYGWLLRRYTATLLSFLGLLSPFFATLHGWLLLGEAPSWTMLASTCFILLGLWIVYSAELKQGYLGQQPALSKA